MEDPHKPWSSSFMSAEERSYDDGRHCRVVKLIVIISCCSAPPLGDDLDLLHSKLESASPSSRPTSTLNFDCQTIDEPGFQAYCFNYLHRLTKGRAVSARDRMIDCTNRVGILIKCDSMLCKLSQADGGGAITL